MKNLIVAILCVVSLYGCVDTGLGPVAQQEHLLLPADGDGCWCAGYGYRCCKAADGDGVQCGGSGLCLPPPSLLEVEQGDEEEGQIDERREIRPEEIVPELVAQGAERVDADQAFLFLTGEMQGVVSLSCSSNNYEAACCLSFFGTNWQVCVTRIGKTYFFETGTWRCRRGRDCL